MSFIMRSFICNKIVQSIAGFPIGGRGIKPKEVLPFLKICPRNSPGIEYMLDLNNDRKNTNEKDGKLYGIGKNPLEIIQNFKIDDIVTSAYVEENPFPRIKFKVNTQKVMKEVLDNVRLRPDSFWMSSSLLGLIPKEKIIVEFSSPNIAKPFHMGHLRSTIVGNFISNLLETLGHEVTRINYLGDWGTQFGLLKYGYDLKKINEDDLKENPIKSLYNLYVWINSEAEKSPDIRKEAAKIFNLMEKGDEKHLRVWDLFRKLSIKEFKKVYSRLNLIFDEYHGESMYNLDESLEILRKMEDNGILKQLPDGRKVYKPDEKSPQITVVKSDGSTMYLTRDIAAAVHRYNSFKFDRMYYVVDNSQHDHFWSLFRILKDLGYDWASNLSHVKFGRIQGMSTRKGTAVFLEDVLEEAKNLMIIKQKESKHTVFESAEESQEVADIVGASAIVVADLKRRRKRDYNFSWDNAIQSNGETGVRLHYSHCRLKRLERTCGVSFEEDVNSDLLVETDAVNLVRQIARFDEVLYNAHKELESSVLLQYLFNLSDSINKALLTLPVKGSPLPVAEARIKLFRASRVTLAAGMKVLGLKPLDRM